MENFIPTKCIYLQLLEHCCGHLDNPLAKTLWQTHIVMTSTFITDSVIKSEPKVKNLNVANNGDFVYFCHHKS